MTKKKHFDCVAYKRAVQEKHFADTQGLSGEQKINARTQWLENSHNPAAKLWRRMTQKREAAHKP